MEEVLDQPSASSGRRNIDELIANGYDFNLGDYISKGYDIFKKNIGMFVVFTLILFVIFIACSFIPFSSLLIQAPLTMGLAIGAWRIAYGKNMEFGHFFKGFDFFVPLLIATILVGLFTAIGLVLLIIPGIYLAVAYSAVNYLIVFHKMDFWNAMETSRKLITKRWWHWFAFAIVLGLINLAGAIALGIGLLFTLPITACAVYAAFAEIAGVDEPTEA